MKTNSRLLKWSLPLAGCFASVIVCSVLTGSEPPGNYIAHEWGTFTSVQGSEGVLLDWRPLESSKLPQFVYDWRKPGLNRLPTSPIFGKGGLVARQRMETPVIYFYSEREQTVNVSVEFPKGLITEWYPQACQIGPSTMKSGPAIAKLDEFAHKAGAKPAFSFAPFFGNQQVKESRAKWVNVHLLPAERNRELAAALPSDRSGSHYFAARETDANFLRLSSLNSTNPAPEQEKFIFYRGAGNFTTPLKVTMDSTKTIADKAASRAVSCGAVSSAEMVTIANTGQEGLSSLFLLGVENGHGKFVQIARLAPGQEQTITINVNEPSIPLEQLSAQLGEQMAKALVSEGLYEREAKAMVNTWKDSWFAEEGLRVLYTLPRESTDRTLPLTLDPKPRAVVRVMVGRSEIIPPRQQQKLSEALVKAKAGDTQARDEALAEFKKLGRFGEPAWRLATQGLDDQVKQMAWSLYLTASAKPPVVSKAL